MHSVCLSPVIGTDAQDNDYAENMKTTTWAADVDIEVYTENSVDKNNKIIRYITHYALV